MNRNDEDKTFKTELRNYENKFVGELPYGHKEVTARMEEIHNEMMIRKYGEALPKQEIEQPQQNREK